jgi:hypothetical protein
MQETCPGGICPQTTHTNTHQHMHTSHVGAVVALGAHRGMRPLSHVLSLNVDPTARQQERQREHAQDVRVLLNLQANVGNKIAIQNVTVHPPLPLPPSPYPPSPRPRPFRLPPSLALMPCLNCFGAAYRRPVSVDSAADSLRL